MNTSSVILFLMVFGGIWWLRSKYPWLAHLPGDVTVRIGQGHIVIPLATCLLASVVATIILLLVGRKP